MKKNRTNPEGVILILEYWNDGKLEDWKDGIMGRQNQNPKCKLKSEEARHRVSQSTHRVSQSLNPVRGLILIEK
ncbi:MAG: hypothetical protein QY331_07440 [Melioribacteraceae bacterium]|nr:MAG: hypothetical protein QY331_07440 [Melioribacteraceae bacterium]